MGFSKKIARMDHLLIKHPGVHPRKKVH